MKLNNTTLFIISGFLVLTACNISKKETSNENENKQIAIIEPDYVTEKVAYDTDDPAIWYNEEDPSASLIIGTDQGDDNTLGGLYVFNLHGQIDREKSITNLERPNNVDIAYDFIYQGDTIDIAVCTERFRNAIRVFRLPELTPIDAGGIKVFEGDSLNAPMGIALYTQPSDGKIFAIVGRKEGPKEGYFWQYQLTNNDNDEVVGEVVRKFGNWSGIKEIEAIAVDDQLGYVYYSDEHVGIRKQFVNPDSSNVELALFGKDNFGDDREGISIYPTGEKTGYILVSDQGSNEFHVFDRSGNHDLIAELPFSTMDSDGSESSNKNFGQEFPKGIFVAMSTDKTFHIYDWRKIQRAIDER
jgi:3-phytase